jgi:hypothetical protein
MKLMLHSFLVGLFVAIINPIHAQFGIGGKYTDLKDAYWQEVFDGGYNDRFGSVNAMYWFRLKKKRVEFLPEIGYARSLNNISAEAGPANSSSVFYLQFNTDVYFLDFGSDCNCPTFSKDGDILQRGLFVEVSPGVEFRKLGIDYLNGGELDTRFFNKTVPRVYGGFGFDIGLSDLITVTPTVGLAYTTGTAWDGVEEFLDFDPTGVDETGRDRDLAFQAGVRILLRPDYLRRNRR